jgi:hypothetical protein
MGAVRMLAYQILQHLRRRDREAVERLRPVHESMSPHAAAAVCRSSSARRRHSRPKSAFPVLTLDNIFYQE